MRIEGYDEDKVVFSDGSTITYSHEPDCCEYNYADFSVLDIFYDGEEFNDYYISETEYGFVLNLVCCAPHRMELPMHELGYFTVKKIYIPCYSEQNGYYSNSLMIHIEGKKTVYMPIEAKWLER